jgi:hypothetical protein
MASDGHKRKRAPCCRACPESAQSYRLAIGGIAYWFAVMEQKTVTPGPVDLDGDAHGKRGASSRITNSHRAD